MLLLLLSHGSLHARPGAERRNLELRLLRRVLLARGLTPCPDPEGKRVGRVVVVAQDVFTPADPFPDELNAVHRTTREQVVLREVLLGPGALWDRDLVQESSRNLRGLLLFSVVLIVPVLTDSPAQIDLLVFVKDLWSLRLEWNIQSTGFGIDLLQGALTERNIAGLGKQGRLRFGMDRGKWSLGQSYTDPRLAGSRWAFMELADVVFPRGGGGPEGLVAQAVVARPLATTATRWGTALRGSFSTLYSRRFVGADLQRWDDPGTLEAEDVPWEYRRQSWSLEGLVVRSFGRALKTNLSLGAGVERRQHWLPDGLTSAAQQQRYAEWAYIPAEQEANYLIGRLHHFANRHEVFRDLDSYAISEDRRMGHDLDLVVRGAHGALLSPEDWLELTVQGGWRGEVAGGHLLELSSSLTTRRDQGAWRNNRVGGALKTYSPRTRLGRVVYRIGVDLGWRDDTQTLLSLGGENSLRGYLSGSRVGLCAVRHNLELRSRAWDLRTVQLGWALFWDGGDAFDDVDTLDFRHSVGAGLRILLPQVNREVIRVDFGVPLSGRESGPAGWVFLGFFQAF